MSEQNDDYKTIDALDEAMSGYATSPSTQRQTKTKCNRIMVMDEPSELRRKRQMQKRKEHQSATIVSPRKDEDGIETLLLSDNEDRGGKPGHVEHVRKPKSQHHILKPKTKRRSEYKRTPVIDLRNEGRRGKPSKATGDYQKQYDNTVSQVTDETHHIAPNSGGNKAATLKKNISKYNPFSNVGYAKIYPIDDGSQPIVRNKKQLDKISSMFCVESAEEAEARPSSLGAAKSPCAETMVQKFLAPTDDDDDDDCFRPGVWNCRLEFKRPTSNAQFHTLGRCTPVIEDAGGRTSKPILVNQTKVTVDVTEAWNVEKAGDEYDIPVGCMAGLRKLFRRIFKRN